MSKFILIVGAIVYLVQSSGFHWMVKPILIAVAIVLIILLVRYRSFIKLMMKRLIVAYQDRKVGVTSESEEQPTLDSSLNEELVKEMTLCLQNIAARLKGINSRLEQISNVQKEENAKIKVICNKLETVESKLQILSILPVIEKRISISSNRQEEALEKSDSMRAGNKQTLFAIGIDSVKPLGFRTTSLSSKYSGQLFQIEKYSANSGTLTIVDKPSVKASLLTAMYQMVANGICEVESESTSTPTDIFVIADGKVCLINDLWEITSKIVVKLI